MMPGRWLHRLAGRCCAVLTREQIVEPLLADLQHQWLTSSSRIGRARTLIRGYAAFWQTLAFCGGRASARALTTVPAHITFEKAFIGFYAIAIVMVILFGFAWVRTGDLTNPTEGLIIIRHLAAAFGPGFLLNRYWPRAGGRRGKILVAIVFASAAALSWWMNPDFRLGSAFYNVLYLCIFARQRRRLA